MKKIILILILILLTTPAYAGTVSRYFTYATTSQVTSTNLNGNFDNIVTVMNGGLDNSNANTSGGYRFYEVVGALSAAGTQGRTQFLTTDNTLNFDTGAAWVKTITIETPAVGYAYYNGSSWTNSATTQSSQAVGVTSAPTTTSTSYVDLTDMSITMTTGANPVLILFSGTFQESSTTAGIYIIIDIDGTDKNASERLFYLVPSQEYRVMSTSWLETMTAGSHTFKIQWKGVTSATNTAYGIQRAMQVIELK